MSNNYRIDNLQYCNWSREIFQINREAKLDAVHVTIVYHEDYDELLLEIKKWQKLAENNSDLIFLANNSTDIEKAKKLNKTAVFFGFQNCSPIEDDISLVEKVHQLGCRFMQLTYNNQSLLATGCYERNDSGVTNFGREVIREMNRVGIVIDMSHSAEKSSLDAIEFSEKPIAITHANPSFWHPAKRNKSNDLLKVLNDSNGMLGLSLYPHHLHNNSKCTLESFCEMVAKTAEIMDVKNIGIGSDLCLNQPDKVVEWMRNGTWTKTKNYGEGSKNKPGFPEQPNWFKDARGFDNIENGLKKIGFSEEDVNGILGNNWYNFYKKI
ncbi:membrane dipeptidase [Candidatus Pelagibacter sp.]|uniref:membrane dipeptidase n=1 Tax=Candidatus Pelagibacter sp. TaxID=2024849 RepID=UPI003F848207